MSRFLASETVTTKWAAIRCAASTVVSPRNGFHHQVCGWLVMCCGSNSQVRPTAARSLAVAAHRSALLLVATAGPGADRTYGTAIAVVFPDRGAMKAMIVSS